MTAPDALGAAGAGPGQNLIKAEFGTLVWSEQLEDGGRAIMKMYRRRHRVLEAARNRRAPVALHSRWVVKGLNSRMGHCAGSARNRRTPAGAALPSAGVLGSLAIVGFFLGARCMRLSALHRVCRQPSPRRTGPTQAPRLRGSRCIQRPYNARGKVESPPHFLSALSCGKALIHEFPVP